MYKHRRDLLRGAMSKFRFKKVQLGQNDALLFSYSPEFGSDPWNSWSVLPWEYDPWLYQLYRRSVSAIVQDYKYRRMYKRTGATYIYFLDNFEVNFDMFGFSFWHSNEMPTYHAFGLSFYKGMLEDEYMPTDSHNLPYTFFALLRYSLLNFYRFRIPPSKQAYPWGLTYSFARVPSWMFKLEHRGSLLRVAWAIPYTFLQKWTDMEHEEWENPQHPQFVNYYNKWTSTDKLIKKTWFPPRDVERHRQLLKEIERWNISKQTQTSQKHFFVFFSMGLWHADYEYYALDDPRLFHFYAYPVEMRVNWLRHLVYQTKESDIIRFYVYCLYKRVQFDTDYTDSLLKFVSWLEFLTWKGQWFGPFPYFVKTYNETWDKCVFLFNKKMSLPFFSRVRKTFFKKK